MVDVCGGRDGGCIYMCTSIRGGRDGSRYGGCTMYVVGRDGGCIYMYVVA